MSASYCFRLIAAGPRQFAKRQVPAKSGSSAQHRLLSGQDIKPLHCWQGNRHLYPSVCFRYSAQNHSATELIEQLGGLGCVALHIEQKWGKTNGLMREDGLAIRQIFKWLCTRLGANCALGYSTSPSYDDNHNSLGSISTRLQGTDHCLRQSSKRRTKDGLRPEGYSASPIRCIHLLRWQHSVGLPVDASSGKCHIYL